MKRNALILMGMLTCLVFSACGTDSTENTKDPEVNVGDKTDSGTTDQDMDDGNDSEAATQDSEDNEPEEVIYNLGDTVTLENWEITVTDVQVVETIESGTYTYFEPEEGSKFLQIYLTATNNGQEEDTFLPTYYFGDDIIALVYHGTDEYSPTYLIAYDNEMHGTSLEPLSSKSGEIAFEMPDSVVEADDELILQFSIGSEKVKYKIR